MPRGLIDFPRVVDHKRGRFGGIQDTNLVSMDLYVTRGNIWILAADGALAHQSHYLNDKF